MKVGILTFHDADNYGAVLQCFALQEVLKNMEYEVHVINYKQEHVVKLYQSKFKFQTNDFFITNLQKLKSLVKKVLYLRINKEKHLKFENFRSKYLHITEPVDIDFVAQNYDVIIVGSDQMWSFSCCGGFDPIYWGQFPKNKQCKLVGYAISGNGDFINYLTTNAIINFVSSFDKLSFREEIIQKIICDAVGILHPITLDPTLLTDTSIWDSIIDNKWNQRKKYIVVYQARIYVSNPDMIMNKARQYARKHRLEIVNLTSGNFDVVDFVSSIKYAAAVFTSSFHATVFSIIFRTPFVSFKLNDGRDERYLSLLNILDLSNHIVDETFNEIEFVPNVKEKTIDIINSIKMDSYNFLKNIN